MRRSSLTALLLALSFWLTGCLHAPMPWSPDGQWIAYTVEVRPLAKILRPGWLFDNLGTNVERDPGRSQATGYRLWATRKATGTSVLLEDSPQPLTSPGWSPDGRSLAFGRIMVQPDGPTRFEVVLLEGPARRRVLCSQALTEITAEASRLPGQAIAWSPDGRYLAIPQLSPLGLAIVRADNGRQLNTINDAFLPSWSPDGSRLAFFTRGTVDTLSCIDSPVGQPRPLLEVGQGGQAPIWSRDGLTLLVSARRSVPKGGEPPGDQVELIRLRVDIGQAKTIQSLSTEAVLGRDRSVEGVSIAFDDENLFCSNVVEGGPQVITWYRPRENEILKKFWIVDFSAAVGSLSLSPDGSILAARVGPAGRLGAPAFCDLESNDVRARLIAPDDSSRVEWIATLVASARSILAALPTASADPKSPSSSRLDRPTILPVLGEFEANSESTSRLKRIGKLGRPLCDRPADSPPADPGLAAILAEARLFFDYLAEDYARALPSLEALETLVESPQQRLALLSVRAQISIARGQLDHATQTINYVRDLNRPAGRVIEWDGSSYVLKNREQDTAQGSGWPEYLTWRVRKVEESLREDHLEFPFNPDRPRGQAGIEPPFPRNNPIFPDRPFLDDAVEPRMQGLRPGVIPRLRLPDR